MKALAWIVVGVTWLAGIGGCVFLALHGHPWLALAVLLAGSGAGFSSKRDDDE